MKVILAFNLAFDSKKGRYNLLKIAQEIVKEMKNVNFFSAINCSLAMPFKNGTVKHFNSEFDFRSLLPFS